MAKTMPKVTVKHSGEFKASDLNSHNKRNEKLRNGWLGWGQSQTDVDKMFPVATLETFTSKPGFYAKFSGPKGGDWRGPYDTALEANDAVGEIAYESTYS